MKGIVFVAVGAFFAASCGGGGASNVTPTGAFRANVVGDQWAYDVETINFGIFGDYSGTLAESLSNDTYNNSPSIRFTRTFTLGLSSGPATITGYEEIGSNGQLLAELDGSMLSAVVSDTFNVPPVLTPTTDISGSITLADGTSFAMTYKVTGTAAIPTQAGLFNCWVVSEQVTHSDGATDAYTLWIAPETGNYVQLKDTTVNADGSGYSYTADLTATVTPPATSLARPPILPPVLSVHNGTWVQ